jgi:ribosomal protein L18
VDQAVLLGQRVAEEYEKDAAKDPAFEEATKKDHGRVSFRICSAFRAICDDAR